MLISQCVREVRAFNRFYTVYLGVLDKRYLNDRFSLAEIRILHSAITRPGVTATELVSILNIDKSYLSRMVLRLQRMKLISKKKSGKDGRSANLFITATGKTAYYKLDKISAAKIRRLLQYLEPKDYTTLVKCMATIQAMLINKKLH